MIKLQNILAENMIRFGSKNLTKSEKQNLQRLMEDFTYAFPMALSLPTNKGGIDMTGKASFTISGLGKNAATDYSGFIRSITLAGIPITSYDGLKLDATAQTITGNIWLNKITGQDEAKFRSIVSPMIGKGSNLFSKDPNYMIVLVKPKSNDPNAKTTVSEYIGSLTVTAFQSTAPK